MSALGALMVNVSGAIFRNIEGPPDRLLVSANMLGIALALVSLFELVQAGSNKRAGQVRRVLQGACFLPIVFFAATGNEIMVPILYLLSLAFMCGALLLSLRSAFFGDNEARTLSIGICVLFVTLVYDMASELGALPRQEGLPILGFSLLYLAATRAQSIRHEREHSELVSLRSDLENRVRVRTTELEAANAHLDRLSYTDQLTSLANRRSLIEQVGRALQLCSKRGQAGSIVMIDIDHFKQINDQFGHDAGDRVLVQVSAALVQSFGDGNVIARWGGEEFIVFLPGCELEGACNQAEIARRAVAGGRTMEDGSKALTASFGVAEIGADCDFENALAAADAALYRAKHAGRNRVVSARDDCQQFSGSAQAGKDPDS